MPDEDVLKALENDEKDVKDLTQEELDALNAPEPEPEPDPEPEPEPEPEPVQTAELAEKVKLLEETLEKRDKRIGDQASYISNITSQLDKSRNELRKRYQDNAEKLQQGATYENLDEFVHRTLDQKETAQEIHNIDAQEARLINKVHIEKYIDGYESLVEDIANLAQADGYPMETIAEFRRDPYGAPLTVVLPYAKRVQESKKAQTEIEELRKKADGATKGGADAAAKLKRAAAHKPGLTAGTGKVATNTEAEITSDMIKHMPLEKLREELAKSK